MRRATALCVLALLVLAAQAAAVPNDITYQGVLRNADGTVAPDGSYSLTFRIYDEEETLLWTDTYPVDVSDGVFSATLLNVDLPFYGPYELGISIGLEPELVPRTTLTSVPYAMRAAYSDEAAPDGDWYHYMDNIYLAVPGGVGLGTATPDDKLELYGNNGQVGIRMSYGSQYSALFAELRQEGSGGLVINSNAGGTWADIHFETNGGEKMILDSYGRLGIGTSAPVEKLHVAGTVKTDGLEMSTGAVSGYVLTADAGGVATWQPGGAAGADGDWTITGRDMASAVPGSVAIATTTTRGRLSVADPGTAIYTKNDAGGGTALLSTPDYAVSGSNLGGVALHGISNTMAVYGEYDDHTYFGYLGGQYCGAYGENASGSQGALGSFFDYESVGVRGVHHGGNFGYLGHEDYGAYGEEAAGGNYGGLGGDYYGVFGSSDAGYGVGGLSSSGTAVHALTISGYGLEATNQSASNSAWLAGSDWGVKGQSTGANTGVFGTSMGGIGIYGTSSSGTGVYGQSTTGQAGRFDGDVEVVNGRVITPVLEITAGSDLSEQFVVRGEEGVAPAPGMLVSVDAANPGGLIVSACEYDRRVAGVISGAGGVSPGMLMGQRGTAADGDVAVALSGRVYCLADASTGAIEPGDLLTTSDEPGHAMKAADQARSHGAVIGKAMTALESGRGLVLVLVNLQ